MHLLLLLKMHQNHHLYYWYRHRHHHHHLDHHFNIFIATFGCCCCCELPIVIAIFRLQRRRNGEPFKQQINSLPPAQCPFSRLLIAHADVGLQTPSTLCKHSPPSNPSSKSHFLSIGLILTLSASYLPLIISCKVCTFPTRHSRKPGIASITASRPFYNLLWRFSNLPDFKHGYTAARKLPAGINVELLLFLRLCSIQGYHWDNS